MRRIFSTCCGEVSETPKCATIYESMKGLYPLPRLYSFSLEAKWKAGGSQSRKAASSGRKSFVMQAHDSRAPMLFFG